MAIRMVAAAAVLVSGFVHLWLWWVEDYRAVDVIGPAFLLNGVGGLVIAVLLLAWRHWLPGLLTLGFGASTLGAFIIAATVGLFGVHEQWEGWPVWTAAIAEVVAIVTGAVLLAGNNPLRRGRAPQDHTSGTRRG